MPIRADFNKLWASLPQWFDAEETVKKTATTPGSGIKAFKQIPGMTMPNDWETCCVQVSNALNKSGLNVRYANKLRVLKDGVGNEYMLDVKEMRGYLEQEFGPPEVIARVDDNGKPTARVAVQAQIVDRKGVIAFGSRHIDLWNGSRIHGEHYIQSALWEADSAKKEGIFFWEVIPPSTP